jgi:hypothetical protein
MALTGLNQRIRSNDKLLINVILFTILFLFVSLRFDVGSDYYNYTLMFDYYASESPRIRLDRWIYYTLSRIFSYYQNGYVFVLGFYTGITYFFLIREGSKTKLLAWYMLCFFGLDLFVDSLDRIRQLSAMMVLLASFELIHKRKIKSFFILIIIASSIHISALLFTPAYWVLQIRLSNKIQIFSIVFTIVLVVTGFTSSIIGFIFESTPFYNGIYKGFISTQNQFNTGLGYASKVIFLLLATYILPKKLLILKNSIFLGSIIYIISFGNLNIERFSNYFLLAIFPAGAYLWSTRFESYRKCICAIMIFIYLGFFAIYNLQDRSHIGYQTIFSQNFSAQAFRKR